MTLATRNKTKLDANQLRVALLTVLTAIFMLTLVLPLKVGGTTIIVEGEREQPPPEGWASGQDMGSTNPFGSGSDTGGLGGEPTELAVDRIGLGCPTPDPALKNVGVTSSVDSRKRAAESAYRLWATIALNGGERAEALIARTLNKQFVVLYSNGSYENWVITNPSGFSGGSYSLAPAPVPGSQKPENSASQQLCIT